MNRVRNRPIIISALVTLLSVTLLLVGAYRSATGPDRLNPNYISPLTEFAYGLNFPVTIVAAVISKTIWRGFAFAGVFVEGRDLLTILFGSLWWYLLARHVLDKRQGRVERQRTTTVLLTCGTIAFALFGLMFSRLRPIEGISAVAWAVAALAFLYRGCVALKES